MSKYEVPDGHWNRDQPEPDHADRLTVKSHEVEVIYTVDSSEDMGYGREKYKAILKYDDEDGVHVLYVIEYRWKGNYWRDTTDWDFKDIPEPVRQQVAAVLPVDRATDLDTDVRLMDEGGESRWEKIHKPRMESYQDGGHMWGESYLKEAVKKLDGAAEAMENDNAEERLGEIVDDIQELGEELRATAQEGRSE